MDYGMVFWPEATVKFFFLQTHSFSLHNMFIDGLESCGLL